MEYEDELFYIKKNLLRMAKEGRPVFLYGKDSIDRKTMVGEVAKEISSHSKYIDCSSMSGNDVYDNLTKSGILFGWIGLLFVDNLICEDHDDDTESYRKLAKIIMNRKMEVAEDELEEGGNYEDCRIAEDPESYRYIHLKLLVVYSEDYDSFPNYFQRQFEEISLECEGEPTAKFTDGVETAKGQEAKQEKKSTSEKVLLEIDRNNNLLKYKNKNKKLDPIQIQILILLYENKGNIVTRNVIFNCIWGNAVVCEAQITDHISKIRKAFKVLGIGKEIIQTVRKSKVTKGGYIFNGNIASLGYD